MRKDPDDPDDPDDQDGWYFPTFTLILDGIKDSFTEENDPHEWHSLMVWTMFQLLHKAAVACRDQDLLLLECRAILTSKEVEVRFFQNLKKGGWEQIPDRI